MRSYTTADLTSLTVKGDLLPLAKSLGMRGYSKLRKADLIAAIVAHTAVHVPATKILNTEVKADHAEIVKIMVATVPVTPVVEVEANETDELIFAYRAMRKTIRDMGNVPARVSIVSRMRKLSSQIKACGVDMRTV